MTELQIRGLKWAMVTAVVSGVSVFVNGLAVKGIDPMVHTTVKNSMVGVVMLAILLATGEGLKTRQLKMGNKVKLLLVGVIGGSIPFVLFFSGLKLIGPVEGAMIHKMLVVFVTFLAIPLLKEKVTIKLVLGVLLLYLSNLMLGFDGFSEWSVGHWMVLLATILWAVETIVVKKTLAEVPVNVVVTARMAIGAIVLMGMLVWFEKMPLVWALTPMQWGYMVVLAGLLLAYVTSWYRALSMAPAIWVTAVLVGATIITTLLNSLLITHQLDMADVVQMGVLTLGLGLVVLAARDEGQKQVNKLPMDQGTV